MTRKALLVLLVVLLGACGADSDRKDPQVGPGVRGNGQDQLLGSPIFEQAVRGIGLSPSTRPTEQLGREIGRRLRAITTDAGRIVPGAFSQPYQHRLRRLGRLSMRQFERRYHEGPLEMADRVGGLVGQLDAGLDEGADPAPDIAPAVLEGFGLANGPEPEPLGDILAVRDRINALMPADDHLDCLTHFESSYTFTRNLLMTG